MFNISKYEYFTENNTGEIVYDYGGFQGARGCDDPWGTKLSNYNLSFYCIICELLDLLMPCLCRTKKLWMWR